MQMMSRESKRYVEDFDLPDWQIHVDLPDLGPDAISDRQRKVRRRSAITTHIRHPEEFHPAQGHRLSEDPFEGLADEIGDYLMSVAITYGFSDLRALIRSGHIELSDDSLEEALKLPAGWKHLVRLFLLNEPFFKEAKLETDMYRLVFESFDHMTVREVMTRRKSAYIQDQSFLLIFDDEKSSKDLVYGIGINRARKSIRVTFKGTKSVTDWMVNLDFFMITVLNPLHGKATSIPQSKFISFHRGFYNYLMKPRRRSNVSKYTTIREHLRRLLDENPGFEIEVSGHSLGGAIGTLFAFILACGQEFPSPVRVITFASPRLGNTHFVRAFHELELQGRIYHLRVVNHRDLVTTVPDRSCSCAFWKQNGTYRHVGVELKLYHDRREPLITIPVVHCSRIGMFVDDCSMSMANFFSRVTSFAWGCFKEDYMQWHGCNEYVERILKGPEMSELSLNILHGIFVGEINNEGESELDTSRAALNDYRRSSTRSSTMSTVGKSIKIGSALYTDLIQSIRDDSERSIDATFLQPMSEVSVDATLLQPMSSYSERNHSQSTEYSPLL